MLLATAISRAGKGQQNSRGGKTTGVNGMIEYAGKGQQNSRGNFVL